MFAPEQATTQSSSMPSSTSPQPSTNASLPKTLSPEERRPSYSAPQGLNPRSCVTCRRRKVKCDKKVPCSNCTKAGSPCVFPAPGRAPRRPRTGPKVVSEREAELLKRLRRLEGVVEELSGQVDLEVVKQSPSASDSSSAPKDGDSNDFSHKSGGVRAVGMDEGSDSKKAWITRAFKLSGGPSQSRLSIESVSQGVGRLKVEEGKSRYMESPFWASVSEEVEELKEILEDQEFDSDSDNPVQPSEAVIAPNHQSFVMGYSSSDVDLKNLHPLPSQISFYWETYLENIQPLTKLLHGPSMSKVIKEIRNNLDALTPSMEALMFSIYLAAITSMGGEEVRAKLGANKDKLIAQYRFGVEQALARASFLNTNEIVTFQAFVLFLICVRRHDDTRFVWSMTGLAMRIAQSLGLHRDGTKFGLSPFDTEMRRRLWWQVCMLDTRASQDHGSDPSIMDLSFDTEFPSNINDDDMDPESTKPITPRVGATEMTFLLIRCELSVLTRRLIAVPPGDRPFEPSPMTADQKEKLIRDCSDNLEQKYHQYCDDGSALHWVAATVARLILAKMNVVIYHPINQPEKPHNLSQDVRDRLFMSSIEILEYSRVLQAHASIKKWGWLFQTYIHWHAIGFILGELSSRPASMIVERAWRAIDAMSHEYSEAPNQSKNGMLWQPLRRLMAKARQKRAENMQRLEKHDSLGIDQQYMRPVAIVELGEAPSEYTHLAHENQAHMNSGLNFGTCQDTSMAALYPNTAETLTFTSQITGMDALSPDDIQFQLQQEQMHVQHNGLSWLPEDNGFLDMDMHGIDGDASWGGWEDMVRDFQSELDNRVGGVQSNGPELRDINKWW